MTHISAKPPMEYCAIAEPSVRLRREVPSYRCPCKRLCTKKVSHSSSCPRRQCRHEPHGIMKVPTTRWPTEKTLGPAPMASTVPEISWPNTHGAGKVTLPCTTCRSEWHTPQAAVRMSTSPACGVGSRSSSIVNFPPIFSRTAARMVIPVSRCE